MLDRKVLRLDAAASKPVRYALNGTPFQLTPGNETILQRDQKWALTYVPGPGQPERSLTIDDPGTYVFREGPDGWELDDNQVLLEQSPALKPPVVDLQSTVAPEPILAPVPVEIEKETVATPAEKSPVAEPVENQERSILNLTPANGKGKK